MVALLGVKRLMTQVPKRYRVFAATVIDITDAVVAKKAELDDLGKVVWIGYGKKKKPTKPEAGQFKELGYVPKKVVQVAVNDEEYNQLEVGKPIPDSMLQELFAEGKKVDVVGVSKGKGFAGVIKRWGFSRQPKTHGQSDRERHPGAIGAQTPGRVFKGKKMAGRMGNSRVTVQNLEILRVLSQDGGKYIIVKGSVPGAYGRIVLVRPAGNKI